MDVEGVETSVFGGGAVWMSLADCLGYKKL